MQRAIITTAPLILGLLAGGSLEVQNQASWAGVERVKVRWAAGDINVTSHDGALVDAETKTWGPEAPLAYDARRDGEILILELTCRTPAPCGGDLELSLPAGVELELDLGEGLAELTGDMGDSSVIVGKGEIHASALSADEAVLQVVEGSIDAFWAEIPERVVVATVTGDVELRLPVADYALEDQLGHSSFVGLTPVPGAPNKVQVTTVEGEAVIYGIQTLASLGASP